MKPYRAPWWLPGGHIQTLHAYLFARKPRVAYRRERWELADGDFLDLDWVDGDAAKHQRAPLGKGVRVEADDDPVPRRRSRSATATAMSAGVVNLIFS